MSGTTVNINPDIIKWILEKVQLGSVDSPVLETLKLWQSGEKAPTLKQLESISKKVNMPFGYFFLKTPPIEECKIVEYRTIESIEISEPSRNLIDTVDQMTDIQDWMREYLIENGGNELAYVARCNESSETEYIADDIRKSLGLQVEWYLREKTSTDLFKYLRTQYEHIGILVMMNGVVGQNTHRKLNINEFRAFTLIDKYAPLIFINACDTEAGKIFSMLHELAHIWLGTESFYNDKYGNYQGVTKEEQKCNAVAAELLVPNLVFKQKWLAMDSVTMEKFEDLSKYFRCSKSVILRRALHNAYINNKDYESIAKVLAKEYEAWEVLKGNKKSGGGDYYKTMNSRLDTRLLKALTSSTKEGRTQYTEAYRLTNTNRATFSKLVGENGGVVW